MFRRVKRFWNNKSGIFCPAFLSFSRHPHRRVLFFICFYSTMNNNNNNNFHLCDIYEFVMGKVFNVIKLLVGRRAHCMAKHGSTLTYRKLNLINVIAFVGQETIIENRKWKMKFEDG